ncbi:hypothetical protein CTheo_233 [Ceratobasidium theobromae]|uniref:Uncharacterized protein n=1 Tax=Ceratobasidium theobromae TaxID=1582974 RepID=A0A5N5QX33_9AGAM|nr:hypothetical protein CTheo_233 [Ceratobasidium theobromae]
MYRSLLVYMIRHGETDENRQGIIQGQMDTQLNDAGRNQAKLAGKALKGVHFVRAYSSDSSRAADTAQAIVAHHPKCELILDARIRERYMGSLSGTKAPAKRPLPPDVENTGSLNLRLHDFWDNVVIPLLSPSLEPPALASTSRVFSSEPADHVPTPQHIDSHLSEIPAILIVSHGATLSKLIRDVLLLDRGYTVACDISRRGIHNTSISVLRMDACIHQVSGEDLHPSVSGELLSFASLAHLFHKRKSIVTENADMLEQRNESHVDWMSRSVLKDIIEDLKPLIGPKLAKESYIGASGLSASEIKKAGQSVVEVHRGENYQFAYFLKAGESYDVLLKTRDFVAVTAQTDPFDSFEKSLTPEPSKQPKKRADAPNKKRKRAPKPRPKPKVSAAAKKQKRVEESDEEAEMPETWSDLDDEDQGSDNNQIELTPSGAAPTRRSARHKSVSQVQLVDEENNGSEPSGAKDSTTIIVKSEPDDTSAFANLLTIGADDEPTLVSQPQSPRLPIDHLVIEEEEKPKQELRLTYIGHIVPSRCICVIVEPWPVLPTPAQLASQVTKSRPKQSDPRASANAPPLFRPESDDEDDEGDIPMRRRSPNPGFDPDDEGGLRMFSQMINEIGEKRSGVATRGAMDEFEDDALYGDADEEGRGV